MASCGMVNTEWAPWAIGYLIARLPGLGSQAEDLLVTFYVTTSSSRRQLDFRADRVMTKVPSLFRQMQPSSPVSGPCQRQPTNSLCSPRMGKIEEKVEDGDRAEGEGEAEEVDEEEEVDEGGEVTTTPEDATMMQ